MDRGVAACRAAQFVASGNRLFLLLRRKGVIMTRYQINMLVSKWLREALDEREDDLLLAPPMTDHAREALSLGISDQRDGVTGALLNGDWSRMAGEAEGLLQAAGLSLDHGSIEFRRLCQRLLLAKVEFLKAEEDRLEARYPPVRREMPPLPTVPPSPSPPFSVVLEKFLTSVPRPARTLNPLRSEFLKFLKVIGGDRPIGSIGKPEAVRYKEHLVSERKSHPTTIIRHLSALDGLFRFAQVHGYVPDGVSPVRGLAPSKRQSRKERLQRVPFTDDELKMVLSSPEFLRMRTERPERWWVVLLLLFQVCRREEAAQLYVKDLTTVEGIPCMTITDKEPDQTLKNEGSKRRIPIHSKLIELGFLDYVATIKAKGHPRVFPQLDRKGMHGYGDPVGKWWGRLIRGLGLTDPGLVIHSLRHGGITKLHSAGVPVNIVEMLVGHSAGNVHVQYVHKDLIAVRTLKEGLEKLQYSDVVKVLSTV